MDDKTYSVRVSFFNGNPITLELKGCGSLYILPGRDYFFINAPMNFLNYLAQLKRCGIEYRITSDSNGCYYSVDLRNYNAGDPRYMASNLRKLENPTFNKREEKKPKETVVLSSDDLVPREEAPEAVEEAELNQMIAEDLQKSTNEPEVSAEVVVEATEPVEVPEEVKEEPVEEVKEEPKVYTEEQLSKYSKAMLLEISADYGLECSDINTKKEIRDAILEAQNK